MFNQLSIQIEFDKEIDYRKSSVFQGVLFENIDSEYASFLHQQGIHPYSQYIYNKDDKTFWVINSLNEEAYEKIIKPLYGEGFNKIKLNKSDTELKIIEKNLRMITKESLISEMNEVSADRYVNLKMITPMSFKQRGVNVCYPDMRLIYQSIMNRYSGIMDNMTMFDEDTLNQIVENTLITKYRVRSTVFPMEKINIPGSIGEMRLRFLGTEVMARYARLLFRFSEFSGIGMKTGMGMGAVKIELGGSSKK